jgi:predicted PurR-regulated permease PerM
MAEKQVREKRLTARRVFIDPSTPSVQSILRVVLVVFLGLIIVAAGLAAIYYLSSLIFLLILSVFFAYLINPLVRLIRKPFRERHLERFMPRPLAIGIAYIFVFAVLVWAISYLAPRLIEQAKEFAGNLPNYSEQAKTQLEKLNERYSNVQIPEDVKADLNKKVGELIPELGGKITSLVGGLAISFLSISPFFFLIPILAFFFLKDVNAFRLSVLRMFPSGRWRHRAETFIEDVNTTLAAYTRAQLISCFLIGTICTIGFYFLDVNYTLLLGILAGILEFIPLIGPLVLAITAITVSAFYSPWQALYVAIFLIILRIVHDYVTYPRIVREGIHLHPLAIILSVLAGEQIAGIPGVFLSIPIVALITVLIKHIREHRQSKGLVADLLKDEEKIADS